jgi:hypothetical protein
MKDYLIEKYLGEAKEKWPSNIKNPPTSKETDNALAIFMKRVELDVKGWRGKIGVRTDIKITKSNTKDFYRIDIKTPDLPPKPYAFVDKRIRKTYGNIYRPGPQGKKYIAILPAFGNILDSTNRWVDYVSGYGLGLDDKGHPMKAPDEKKTMLPSKYISG